jgi:hypothetical protein
MRVIEVRRHSLVRDHVHVSKAGIELARRVGSDLGPFDRVVTSHITRTPTRYYESSQGLRRAELQATSWRRLKAACRHLLVAGLEKSCLSRPLLLAMHEHVGSRPEALPLVEGDDDWGTEQGHHRDGFQLV